MPYLDDERWLHLVHTRAEQPHLLLVPPPEHLREPVVEGREPRCDGSANHHEVEVRHYEVGVVPVHVQRR